MPTDTLLYSNMEELFRYSPSQLRDLLGRMGMDVEGAPNLRGIDLRVGVMVYAERNEAGNKDEAKQALIYELMEDNKIVDKLLAKQIAYWLIGEVEGTTSSNLNPMMRFKKYLAEASITRPDEKVLTRIATHFSNRASFVFDKNSAADLYEFVKRIPGSTTSSTIEEKAQVKLNGPYETESSAVLITGADSEGRPILVKVLWSLGDKAIQSETDAVLILGLENPRECLVPSKICSLEAKGKDLVSQNVFSGNHKCIIMPLYPSTLLKMAHLLPEIVIYREGMKIRKALKFIHEQGLVHMDVKPANIFVSSDGNWVLGDYGACVRIGDTVHSTTQAFFPEEILKKPARTGFDSLMLCVSLVLLVCDFDQIAQHNILRIEMGKLKKEIESIELKLLKCMLLELYEEYTC